MARLSLILVLGLEYTYRAHACLLLLGNQVCLNGVIAYILIHEELNKIKAYRPYSYRKY